MRLVIALGGNALLKRGEPLTAENQRRNMRVVAGRLSQACKDAEVVVVHGNGPQVGLLALEAAAYHEAEETPLDILVAESQGMIGYVIAQELLNANPLRPVTTLMTQTVIDPTDTAFDRPTKPIGPVYTLEQCTKLRKTTNWAFGPDGDGFRRLAPSPRPLEIVELTAIKTLLSSGAVVICGGGGGIPVCRGPGSSLFGVEAVVDKDMTAARLAEDLGADRLIILTDVDAVYADWDLSNRRPLRDMTVADLREYVFAEGSMAPKVEAACEFVWRTERTASIGRLDDVMRILAGEAGTIVRP